MVEREFLIATTEQIQGFEIIEVLGVVNGNTVRSKHIGKDIMAGLKNIIGGEIQEYTEMLGEARQESVNRMIKEAKLKGADAVVGFRFATSTITTGAAELLAYGTAVKLKNMPGKTKKR